MGRGTLKKAQKFGLLYSQTYIRIKYSLNILRMFNMASSCSLLVKPGRIWAECLCMWILRTSLQKMFPSPGMSARTHSEVRKEIRLSSVYHFNLLHVLALP